MSNNSTNYVNISSLPILNEISPGEYFPVKTLQGDALIDYADLPFVAISGKNITYTGTVSAANLNIVSTISSSSAYFDQIFVNGVSGVNGTGEANYLIINSGIVTSALNVPSFFYNQLSSTFDSKLNAVSAAIPVIFYDGGVVNVDGGTSTPVYSEVVRGSNNIPAGVYISPNDINIKFLWNTQLDNRLATVSITPGLSNIPIIYVEESVSNNYIDSNSKVIFRAIFRPPLLAPARIAWNVIKVIS